MGCARSNCLLERIKVDDYEVDFGNTEFAHCLDVFVERATTENAAEYLGMQSLHTAAQNRWIAGEVFHRIARIALFLNKGPCTAGR